MSKPHALPRIDESDLDECTAIAGQDLESLRAARLFITGGTGYIGRWLLASLLHANRRLDLDLRANVLTRDPDGFTARHPQLACDPAVSLVQGDIRDFPDVPGEFTHVIHGATDVVATHPALETFDVTVLGTRRVLEFASEHGARNVLLLSSGAVYGPFPEGMARVPETFGGALNSSAATSAYGLGKMVSEWLGNTFGQQYGLACKSARIFAQIGPSLELDAQFAAGNFIRDALLGQALRVKGDGTPLRSYMYATDLVAWLLAILVRGRPGAAYNVGSDQAISISALAQSIARLSQSKAPDIRVQGMKVTGDAPNRYVPDTSLAHSELGLAITVPLEDALQRTIDWYRPHIQRLEK